MQIEPALPGHKVTHLDQPQQVVIVAAGVGQRWKSGAGVTNRVANAAMSASARSLRHDGRGVALTDIMASTGVTGRL